MDKWGNIRQCENQELINKYCKTINTDTDHSAVEYEKVTEEVAPKTPTPSAPVEENKQETPHNSYRGGSRGKRGGTRGGHHT